MAVFESPKAEQQSDVSKAQEVLAQLSSTTIGATQSLRINYEQTVSIIDNINSSTDFSNTPWRNITQSNTNEYNFFDLLLSPPLSDVFNPSSGFLGEAKPNSIPGFTRAIDYSNIFNTGFDWTEILLQDVEQAKGHLENFNVSGYKNSLKGAQRILGNFLHPELDTYIKILEAAQAEISNSQSPIYKGENAYGPFPQDEINGFDLPPDVLASLEAARSLRNQVLALHNDFDKLGNISDDILSRIALENNGLIQSSTDPDVFIAPSTTEKDPWGIRFSYVKSITGANYVQSRQSVKSNSIKNKQLDEEREFALNELETNKQLFENSTINQTRDFYFQLLPAIKSNLPISGGTDVPGAMPGVQFRIENNIVKHRIPGYSPIYQPIGIDCIKCTLVGMFTGHDGVNLSRDFNRNLTPILLEPGQTLQQKLAISSSSNPADDFYKPTSYNFNTPQVPSPTGGTNKLDNDGGNSPVDIPDPLNFGRSIYTNRLVVDYDAFRSAQDFYNEIVMPGREVEVELNLRKGSAGFPGGSPGPFRNSDTGNPTFRALIKRLDLYYTRRDRCWFIIDLEITNAGLHGSECINLTNIVEEAVDLLDAISDRPTGLAIDQLNRCFGPNSKEYKLTGRQAGQSLKIDFDTGLSYIYDPETNTLDSSQSYPLQPQDTIRFIVSNRNNGIIKGMGPQHKKLQLMYKLAALGTPEQIRNSTTSKNFLTTKLPIITRLSRFYAFDKASGLFRVVKKDGTIANDRTSSELKRILFNIDFAKAGSFNTFAQFLSEYIPLLKFPDNNCTNIITSQEEQSNTQTIVSRQSSNNNSVNIPQDILTETANNSSNPGTLEPSTVLTNDSNEISINEDITIKNKLREAKEVIDRGDLDSFLNQSLNEYLALLNANNSDIPTKLTSNLINTTTTIRNQGQVLSSDITNATLVTNRTRLDIINSDTNQFVITSKFNVDSIFRKQTIAGVYTYRPEGVYNVKYTVKAFTTAQDQKVFKIDSINVSFQ